MALTPKPQFKLNDIVIIRDPEAKSRYTQVIIIGAIYESHWNSDRAWLYSIQIGAKPYLIKESDIIEKISL